METQKLIDKFQEIKQLTEDLPEQDTPADETIVEKIYSICENVIIDWKVEKRLENEKRA